MGKRAKAPMSIWVAYLLLQSVVAGSFFIIYSLIQRLSLTISDLIQGPVFWWYLLVGMAAVIAIVSLALRFPFSRWLTAALLALVVTTSLYTGVSTGFKYSLLDVIGGLVVQSIYIVPAIAVIYAMLFSERVKLYFGIPAEATSSDAPSGSTAAE